MKKEHRIIIFTFLMVCCMGFTLFSPIVSETDVFIASELDNFIQEQMKKHNLPGVALAITKGEEIIYAKAFGVASKDEPLNTDTPLYIGSLTKSFTALAIMQLQEQGLLDIDDPVVEYLPWFELADNEATNTITLRNLLNQASGLSDFGYMPDNDDDLSIVEGVERMKSAELTAPIGTKFQYFNSNYSILGAVVQQVSGLSYEAYIEQEIFQPLGMNNSYAVLGQAQQAGLPDGYGTFFSFSLPREQRFRQYDLPAGYLIMSVEDLSQYLRAQINEGVYEGVSILSPEGVTAMHTPAEGIEVPYGMGWFIYEKNGIQIIEHGGTNENYHTAGILLPELDMTIAIQVNKNGLLNAMWGNPQLNDGVLAIVTGSSINENGISMRLLGWVILAVFMLNMFFNVRSMLRMKDWFEKYLSKKRFAQIWDVESHFIISFLLVVILPKLIEAFLQRGFSWEAAFYQAPDLMFWFALGILFDLVQGVWKLIILRKNRKLRKR